MALTWWNEFRRAKTLLTVAALFVCFCTFFSTGTGEAKAKVPCLMTVESHVLEIDGREAVRIQIGTSGTELSYAIMANEQNELRLALENVKIDKKFPSEYVPNGTIADKITVVTEGNSDAILTIEAKDAFLHKDAFRIHTMPGDANGNVKEYLIIDLLAPLPPPPPSPVEGHSIVIDPGHGGSDSGAVGYSGVREKDVALAVSMRVEELLREAGAHPIMTRTEDVDVAHVGSSSSQELQARVDVSLAHPEAELFLSVHCNSFTNPDAHGMETYYYPKTDADEHFAALLNEELAAEGGLYNRGVKYARFYVLRHTEIPASLVELGFLSNPDEEALLANADYREKLAQALFHAIERYFDQGGEE